jgi:hypothetical protein
MSESSGQPGERTAFAAIRTSRRGRDWSWKFYISVYIFTSIANS